MPTKSGRMAIKCLSSLDLFLQRAQLSEDSRDATTPLKKICLPLESKKGRNLAENQNCCLNLMFTLALFFIQAEIQQWFPCDNFLSHLPNSSQHNSKYYPTVCSFGSLQTKGMETVPAALGFVLFY